MDNFRRRFGIDNRVLTVSETFTYLNGSATNYSDILVFLGDSAISGYTIDVNYYISNSMTVTKLENGSVRIKANLTFTDTSVSRLVLGVVCIQYNNKQAYIYVYQLSNPQVSRGVATDLDNFYGFTTCTAVITTKVSSSGYVNKCDITITPSVQKVDRTVYTYDDGSSRYVVHSHLPTQVTGNSRTDVKISTWGPSYGESVLISLSDRKSGIVIYGDYISSNKMVLKGLRNANGVKTTFETEIDYNAPGTYTVTFQYEYTDSYTIEYE